MTVPCLHWQTTISSTHQNEDLCKGALCLHIIFRVLRCFFFYVYTYVALSRNMRVHFQSAIFLVFLSICLYKLWYTHCKLCWYRGCFLYIWMDTLVIHLSTFYGWPAIATFAYIFNSHTSGIIHLFLNFSLLPHRMFMFMYFFTHYIYCHAAFHSVLFHYTYNHW